MIIRFFLMPLFFFMYGHYLCADKDQLKDLDALSNKDRKVVIKAQKVIQQLSKEYKQSFVVLDKGDQLQEKKLFDMYGALPQSKRSLFALKGDVKCIQKHIFRLHAVEQKRVNITCHSYVVDLQSKALRIETLLKEIVTEFKKNKSLYRLLKKLFLLKDPYKKELLLLEKGDVLVRQLKDSARRHVGYKYQRYPLVTFVDELEDGLDQAYGLMRKIPKNFEWLLKTTEKLILDLEELRAVIMSDRAYVFERRLYLYEKKPSFAKTGVKYICSHMLFLMFTISATIGTIFVLGL